MSGAHFAVGACWSCGDTTSFDPTIVPSMPLDARGQPAQRPEDVVRRAPLCEECVKLANPERRKAGLPEWSEDPRAWQVVEGLPE